MTCGATVGMAIPITARKRSVEWAAVLSVLYRWFRVNIPPINMEKPLGHQGGEGFSYLTMMRNSIHTLHQIVGSHRGQAGGC